MYSLLSAVCALAFPNVPVASAFEQVAPAPQNGQMTRSDKQERAVVLIHGYRLHFTEASAAKASYRDWQRPNCLLVKALAKEADVFSHAYGQNGDLDQIAESGGLAEGVAQLRKLGYSEIVLIGHSAGGLIARHFVEDNPDTGVTKVIQVCAPNGGSIATTLVAPKAQRAFLACLTHDGRQMCLKKRTDKRIPDKVEFVCLMGTSDLDGDHDSDGIVPSACQWTPDLQKQGVPVVPLDVSHRQATRTAKGADVLSQLVREKQPRWDAEQVEKTAQALFKAK